MDIKQKFIVCDDLLENYDCLFIKIEVFLDFTELL